MIYINDIPSLRDPESSGFIYDDRIEKIELIHGNTVQDYGHIDSGDSFAFECIFSKENFQRLESLWLAREKVTLTDIDGTIYTNLRLVFRRKRLVKVFTNYVILSFELWRV